MADSAKILDRLKKLYALTAKPEGREEEARTAAWLLIKTARDNGVTLRFIAAKSAERFFCQMNDVVRENLRRQMEEESLKNMWGAKKTVYAGTYADELQDILRKAGIR